ncbi:MAG: hypothetical protein QNJ32_27460 [Xenococcaceae cyanobacterium MO_167.B27]|nr:hypothetical protein [Xenococcaceae cyanobacterium MO_167.B27]
MNSKESLKKPFTIQAIPTPGGTNLIKLGRKHGLQAINPQFPEYLQYYKAWAEGYREYLLKK